MDTAGRFRLYLTITVAAPLLVLYGVTSEEEAALWVGLAGATLGNGVAAWYAQNVRLWLYGIAGAAAALGVGYGLFSDLEAELWLAVLATALGVTGTGVAARYTPPGRD